LLCAVRGLGNYSRLRVVESGMTMGNGRFLLMIAGLGLVAVACGAEGGQVGAPGKSDEWGPRGVVAEPMGDDRLVAGTLEVSSAPRDHLHAMSAYGNTLMEQSRPTRPRCADPGRSQMCAFLHQIDRYRAGSNAGSVELTFPDVSDGDWSAGSIPRLLRCPGRIAFVRMCRRQYK